MFMENETLLIEVAYAMPQKQQIVTVEVAAGTSVLDTVKQSTISKVFPEIDVENVKMGIFGKSVKPAQAVKAGDRIEVYRPLICDPKATRKARADKKAKGT